MLGSLIMSTKDSNSKLNYIQDKLDDVSSTVHKIDKEVALQKASFEDHLDLHKSMSNIMSENTESLKEHMRRTELNEQQVGILRDVVMKMDQRLSPLEIEYIEKQAIKKYRRDKLVLIAKILGILGALAALAVSIKSL